ncbi:hypothetical protein KC367_g8629 [Hortaea werneckii]|nr:hypothetical protein KC357_g9099 [Hortaea werneckii]KAI7493464.1 hypothetical protein KC367_g8629 [Hortaea werneckii]
MLYCVCGRFNASTVCVIFAERQQENAAPYAGRMRSVTDMTQLRNASRHVVRARDSEFARGLAGLRALAVFHVLLQTGSQIAEILAVLWHYIVVRDGDSQTLLKACIEVVQLLLWGVRIQLCLESLHVWGLQEGDVTGEYKVRVLLDGFATEGCNTCNGQFDEPTLPCFTVDDKTSNELDKWLAWAVDPWYGDITSYLITESVPVPSEYGAYSKSILTRIKRRASSFKLVDLGEKRYLAYTERTGQLSRCVSEEQVDDGLEHLHGTHGHFAAQATMRIAVGKVYWPSRSKDIAMFCRNCHNCQMLGLLRPSAGLVPINETRPMDMWGIAFKGPISPVSRNGSRYICILIDYATQKAWAQPMPGARGWRVVKFVIGNVCIVLGYPRVVYSDNGKQVTDGPFPVEMEKKGVIMITAPIGYPSSVGLAEAHVEMYRTGLQKWAQDHPQNVQDWDSEVRRQNHVIDCKTRRPHGFSSWQMLIGFNPRFADGTACQDVESDVRAATAVIQLGHDADDSAWRREMHFECRWRNMMRSGISPPFSVRGTSWANVEATRRDRWMKPQHGDLVLKRRFALDNQKGKKLEPRWTGPYVTLKITRHGPIRDDPGLALVESGSSSPQQLEGVYTERASRYIERLVREGGSS